MFSCKGTLGKKEEMQREQTANTLTRGYSYISQMTVFYRVVEEWYEIHVFIKNK